jgi:hypothetical protein
MSSKLNPAGSALVYTTYLGGSYFDVGNGIAVDAGGNAYVTGATQSADFPTTAGAFQPTFAGPSGLSDAFVTKLDPTGSALVYSTYLSSALSSAIAVDTEGNAYVTGQTGSVNFPTTAGVFQPIYSGGGDAFVTKINPTGTALIYSTYLGGNDIDFSTAIAADTDGNAYVTGTTASANFATTTGVFQPIYSGGGGDAFVTKINPAGSALVYSTYLGGSSGGNGGEGIAVDADGNAYVAGFTASTNFPTTPGAFQSVYAGGFGFAFVTKFNPTGSGLVYSTYLGGSDNKGMGINNWGTGIAIDAAGNAYVTGFTFANNFPTTLDAIQPLLAGSWDAFVTKLNSTGSGLVYSTYLGGGNGDDGTGIAVDAQGNAYVTGETASENFPITPGAFQRFYAGPRLGQIRSDGDAFVAKFVDVALPPSPAVPSPP